MSIKIGEHTLATRKPADLDGAIAEATGCSAAEIAAQLQPGTLPANIARAAHPFLSDKDAPSLAEFATIIAAGDAEDVRKQVLALYQSDAGKAVEAAA
jgi:hypothetical protein